MPELFERILTGAFPGHLRLTQMEEKIKEIVSAFTKIPASDIGPSTPVDRQAVKSSILLHRMYARLAEAGLVVENYTAVKTFSDLLGSHQSGNGAAAAGGPMIQQGVISAAGAYAGASSGSIGIDIEDLSSLPHTDDFRKDAFYVANFTPAEIAYCILQPDPYASFAGLFSAKEAIVKADGRLRANAFNAIGITHGPEGEPLYPGFHLSISHAGGVAVAVAVGVRSEQAPASLPSATPVLVRQGKGTAWISLLALLVSILALIFGFIR